MAGTLEKFVTSDLELLPATLYFDLASALGSYYIYNGRYGKGAGLILMGASLISVAAAAYRREQHRIL